MSVFVKNMRGEPLMPCGDRKARILLKEGKAEIYQYNPFTIQLKYVTGEAKQEVNVGIDIGAKTIGVAITSEDKVLAKGEIELRDDVSKEITKRKIYRRSRRNRKTRYRQARFQNRKKPEGWLPPSVESRIDNTFRWIDKYCELVPNPNLIIEVGKFDIAKIENPDIEGCEYQEGDMYGYRNRIAYLLARENGICQYCNTRHETGNQWRLHHIYGKEHDRSKDWALLHEECHVKLHRNHEEKVLQKKKPKSYKESTFMNIIRKRIYERYPHAKFTYGNVTFQDRVDLGLEKTHYNDAIAISGIKEIKSNPDEKFLIRQFRIKKRSLHEATPRKGIKTKNITAKRNSKNTPSKYGFCLNDRVEVFGKKGFVSGFTNGGIYVKDYHGNYIQKEGKNYKQISQKDIEFVSHTRGWQFIPHFRSA
jgi:hypothetical protein